MTNDGAPQRQTRNRHRSEPPLYDARYEHDACGVGFVADAGGASHSRVLALALGGLGALGHRGAFAADGASSDGAGVLLPLTPSLVRLLDPDGIAGDRPGVLTVFAPARRRAAGPAANPRSIVAAALAAEGLGAPQWRTVPVEPDALGRVAAASLPEILQALVPRPDGVSDPEFELALACARRRADASARSAGLDGVRGGLGVVEDRRLQGPRRRRPPRPPVPRPRVAGRPPVRPVPPALRHQHAARVVARPAVRVRRPQRRDQHGARQPRGDPRPARRRGRLLAPPGRGRPPPRGRSPPLAGRLGLALARRGARAAGRDRLVARDRAARPGARGARPAPDAAPRRRRLPPPGRRIRRAVGRPGRVRVQRRPPGRRAARPQRPAAGGVVDHRRSPGRRRVRGGRGAARPGEIVRTGRLAPGELLLVDPAAGRVLTDADAKSWVLRRLPLHDAPREVFADAEGPTGVQVSEPAADAAAGDRGSGARGRRRDDPRPALPVRAGRREAAPRRADDGARRARAAVEHGRRHAARRAGARHASRQRPPPPGVRAGHQPADRPRARAGGHGPPDGARPPAGVPGRDARGRRDRPGRTAGGRRPRRAARRGPRPLPGAAPGRAPARRDVAGRQRRCRARGRARPALRRRARRRPRGRRRSSSCPMPPPRSTDPADSPSRPSSPRAPCTPPSPRPACAAGPTSWSTPGTCSTSTGSRWSWPPGPGVVHPRLLLALAREQAGSRGAEELSEHDAVGNMLAALDAGLRKVLARMGISTVASYVGGQLFETLELGARHRGPLLPRRAAWPGAPRGRRPRRRPARSGSRRRGRSRPPSARTGSPTPASPASAATASSTCTARRTRRRSRRSPRPTTRRRASTRP